APSLKSSDVAREVLLPEQGSIAVELRHSEVACGAGISSNTDSDHISLVVHYHGICLLTERVGAAGEVLLLEKRSIAVELRHVEVACGAGIVSDTGSDHFALVVHRHGICLLNNILWCGGGAGEVLLPEQGPVAVELRHREVHVGAGIYREAGSDHVSLVVH